jgi:transposase
VEASSGQVVRYRLSRSGDRKRNHTRYMMAIVQIRHSPLGRPTTAGKRAEGKSSMKCCAPRKHRLSDAGYRCLLA